MIDMAEKQVKCSCGNYEFKVVEKRSHGKMQKLLVCSRCDKRNVIEIF